MRPYPVRLLALAAILLGSSHICAPRLDAQTAAAQLSGFVTDSTGAAVPLASVLIVNRDTGVSRPTRTNKQGEYSAPALQPGHYRVTVAAKGFQTLVTDNVTLNVAQNANLGFQLKVGSEDQTVTVDGSGQIINTTDASVSTVVDRKFVDSMPLNGRSFQSLILLAPGVASATPQYGATLGTSGEFSVNGQRADANNFIVDGVSANNSANSFGYTTAASGGGLPASTSVGTTQALVSVDALQEFKIQTSTYSAEYGRQPGAQISFETRSGTNDWHGSAFDYLRNDVLDANNWFNDNATPIIRKPAERQNDFGGTLGGPLGLPKLYSGKDRTFFFFSYEGLRLSQPQPAQVFYVPSLQLRQQAPTALQPVLNAFPLPNCTTATNSECIDPANGLSPFLLSTSLPSKLDTTSARVDEHLSPWLNLFLRYTTTDSSAAQYAASYINSQTSRTTAITLGGDGTFGSNTTNQFRLNYSYAEAAAPSTLVNYDGAVPVDLQALNDIQANNSYVDVDLPFPGSRAEVVSGQSSGKQHQWNLIDTVTEKLGNHLLRLGIDYKKINVTTAYGSPDVDYTYSSASEVLTNSPGAFIAVSVPQYPEYTNFSAFAQDEWRVNKKINLSLGLRWDVNPPPSVTSGPASLTVNGNFSDPSSLSLAPAGTPFYRTTYYNFAPRLGIAAVLHDTAGHETVFRAGGGVFFDTGQEANSLYGSGYGPGTGYFLSYPDGAANAFPLTTPLSTPLSSTFIPPYGLLAITSPHLQLPYTFQWNGTLEQAIGKNQSVSIGYIGSNGRRLLEQVYVEPNNPQFASGFLINENGQSSSYNSLQVQYKRTLSRGLQVLASYTWSHALDDESFDYTYYYLQYQRGNSDFDVRHNLTAAVSYDVPREVGSRLTSTLLGKWGADVRVTARTSFPVTLYGNFLINPITGQNSFGELNYLGGPVYQKAPGAPGGRVINAAAFALPASSTAAGDAPRNFVRGFGENEVNFAVRRDVPIYEKLHLQFRAEAFNIFNHPNFGYIDPNYGDPLFGQATKTLASSLGGLTSLYQQGGPRSLQFSLRLQF